MSKHSRSPAWPFLSILACLFALSVTAPRAWERIAHNGSLARRAAVNQPGPLDDATVEIPTSSANRQTELPAEPFPEPAVAISVAVEDRPAVESQATTESQATVEPEESGEAVEPGPTAVADNPPETVAAPAPIPSAPAFGNQVVEEASLVASRALAAESEFDVLAPPPPTSELNDGDALSTTTPEVGQKSWTMPTTLLEQLAALAEKPGCRTWTEKVRSQIQLLAAPSPLPGSPSRTGVLDELNALAREGQNLAGKLEDPAVQTQLSRALYAIERRVAIWQQIVQARPKEPTDSRATADRLSARVAEIETLTASSDAGKVWREYLQLDLLRKAARDERRDNEEWRELARQVLGRLARARRSHPQSQFIGDGPLAMLGAELQGWAAEPVTPQRLLARLETYERSGLASDAQLLATDCKWLSWSDQSADRQLAGEVEEYYRNANVRLAMTGALLNRVLPKPTAMQMAISDTLIGVPVRGHSTTWTQLSVRLVPDPKRVRLGLEATGVMSSDTMSTSGPATFYNAGTSNFLVRKLFVIGPRGLRDWPAICDARSGSSLVSIETDFDGIPIFGPLVRGIARNQFEDSQPQALSEAETKLANRARAQLDSEVNRKLAEARSNFQQKLLQPMERLGVEVTPAAFVTTEDRLLMRLRVGNEQQLGAHTPRPRAPSDSLVSLQLHQSVFNNMLERLDLAGRKFSLPELLQWVSKKLDKPAPPMPEDMPDDVFITFARQDAVSIRLNGDRAELFLAIAELAQGRNRWRNFTARATYRPECHDLQAAFVRDGGIRLEGESVKGKPEVLLRGIFSRALAPSRRVALIGEKAAKDPRFADMSVTQFAVEDGWIGLACGTRRKELEVRRRTDGVEKR